MSHYLYTLTSAVDAPPFSNYLKIGHSNDPLRRLVAHKVSSPIPLRYSGLWRFKYRSTAIDVETAAHKRFLSRCTHGEWHDVALDEVKEFVANYLSGRCAFSFAPGNRIPAMPRYLTVAEIISNYRQRGDELQNAA